MPPNRNAAPAIRSSAPSRLSGFTSTTMSRPYGKGRRRRDGGGAKDRERRESAPPSASALSLPPKAGAPDPTGSAVGPWNGAFGTIRSEFVLARVAGTDGRSAAVHARGFATAGACSFIAVFGFPRGRRIAGGGTLAAPGDASGEMSTGGVVSGACAVGADGGRTGNVAVRWYWYQ